MNWKTSCLRVPLSLIAFAGLPGIALAQAWPSQPVKVVVPTPPGGLTDIFSRLIAARLTEIWGQPIVIDNRPGANQIIGADIVAKSPANGYTLLVSEASTFVMNPHLYKKLPYDAVNGFTPITVLVRNPWVIALHPSVPANTFQELVALAKAKPGSLSYGSAGLGSAHHISVDYLKNLLGIDILHVPFKGAAPAVAALQGGQISMMMIGPVLVEPLAQAGKAKLIAVATPRRVAALPNLPTIAESGAPGYEAGTWFALVGPAGMPRDIVAKIHGDVVKVLNMPALKEYCAKQWLEVDGNTPDQFAAYMKSEYTRWQDLIKRSGVTVE
ncbi:MAG: tripartite tricarboxylate transporter substrate binding protein [Betaproteobacteria bacterium]|nr:tripartite tricarboxylate transporter substrate binding protein [Betaproteobacteria bacterium]